MKVTITELPVERDQYGYWTHPEYDKFCDGREHISTDEFNAWMSANGLECNEGARGGCSACAYNDR